ncbi:hypothetical protein [Ekhidna sp.]|uniref:hypothetical protein n=1 Tax=Ekhidna sp. TaxID=2608089 RepID=UPI0032EF4A83
MRDRYFRMIESGQIEAARKEYNRLKGLKNWKYLPTVEAYAIQKGIPLPKPKAKEAPPQPKPKKVTVSPAPTVEPKQKITTKPKGWKIPSSRTVVGSQTSEGYQRIPMDEPEKKSKTGLYIGLGVAGLLVVGLIIFLIARK